MLEQVAKLLNTKVQDERTFTNGMLYSYVEYNPCVFVQLHDGVSGVTLRFTPTEVDGVLECSAKISAVTAAKPASSHDDVLRVVTKVLAEAQRIIDEAYR